MRNFLWHFRTTVADASMLGALLLEDFAHWIDPERDKIEIRMRHELRDDIQIAHEMAWVKASGRGF